jgi:hypothetical protein
VSTSARLLTLERDIDHTGVSGTGTVADGVLWDDGQVTLKWRGPHSSIVNWRNLEDAKAIHGHDGATRVEVAGGAKLLWPCASPWRVGRHLGRTVYALTGMEADDSDVLLGMMDTSDVAAYMVRLHNARLKAA